jgi:hypothetical protein
MVTTRFEKEMKDNLMFSDGKIVISPEIDNRVYSEVFLHFAGKYPNEFYQIIANVISKYKLNKEE